MTNIIIKIINKYSITIKAQGIALFAAMLFPLMLQAQVSDTLKEVQIKARHKDYADERLNNFSSGQKITVIDSLTLKQYRFQSVANLLAQQTSVFIKSYGFNGLATLSFRGASAAQSQVYWNGIPLQNTAFGVTDVSLLRTSAFNKLSIVYGGSAALWGSGNVGGALMLENTQPYFSADPQFRANTGVMAGSFGQYLGNLHTSISSKKWYIAAHIDAQAAKNNFPFTDNNIGFFTANSRLQGYVGQLTLACKTNSKNVFGLTAWAQSYYREIPRALFEAGSVKNQQDEAVRILADWNRTTVHSHLYTKLAYLQDYINYEDSAALLNIENRTHQVFGEAGLKYRLGQDQQVIVFIPVQLARMQRQLQKDVVGQDRVALVAAYSLHALKAKLSVTISGRAMLIDQNAIPLGGLGLSYAITNWFSIRGNVQRTYRAPTLNELYYMPGGNDKLRPEQGWSGDAGYSIKTSDSRQLVFLHDVSYFNRNIKDWIIWFGGSIWTPHNIATVHSRGMETENKLQYRLGNCRLHLGLNTAYVLSTTTNSDVPGDGSVGKQIPYAPRYSGQINAGFAWRRMYLNYNHTYTGYRFITVDESAWLLPYNTGNVQLMYTLPLLSNQGIQFSVQCNNVWNSQYMVVGGRPMPGRNWLAGIIYTRQ